MNDELLRAVVGLPVAALWPLGVPSLSRHPYSRALAAMAVAALVLATKLPDLDAFLLVGLTGATAWKLRPPAGGARQEPGVPPVPLYLAIGAAAVVAAVAAAAIDATTAWETLRDGARSDEVVFVLLGFLAALPLAGAFVGWLLNPMAARLAEDPGLTLPGMLRAGLYIGWCERALVFAFLVGGEPGAAGLTLTAKSVARFPTFNAGSEALAEYVLIGTLLSFLLATGAAVGVRALLGMPAF